MLSSVANHPTLGAYDSLIASLQASSKKEDAARFPRLSVDVDWIEIGAAHNPGVSDSGKDTLWVGVGVQIPLGQRGPKQSVQAFESEGRAYGADKTYAYQKAQAPLMVSVSKLRDAKRRTDLYVHTLVPQAQAC